MYEVRHIKTVAALTVDINIKRDCKITIREGDNKKIAYRVTNKQFSELKLTALRKIVATRIREFSNLLRTSITAKSPEISTAIGLKALWGMHELGSYILGEMLGEANEQDLPATRANVSDSLCWTAQQRRAVGKPEVELYIPAVQSHRYQNTCRVWNSL